MSGVNVTSHNYDDSWCHLKKLYLCELKWSTGQIVVSRVYCIARER
ncbi:MAG: unknown protein [Tomato bushy stunt virus satellite RNA C]|nr:MAG: unknown protein [Tomato bushy stunt virus satellite RNA C]